MSCRVVIPARLESSRLPGKVLADLDGRPVLAHVVAAAQASGLGEVWVASDAPQVLDVARAAGAQAALTRADHPSGSDRIHELTQAQGWAAGDIVVNLQGDEPFMAPALLSAVAELLRGDATADWATVACPIHNAEDWLSPACVKVVCDQQGRALYFSRSGIPHLRGGAAEQPPPGALRHIGLYAYRVGALARYCQHAPSPLEELEKLEQLRALEHGLRIAVHVAQTPPPAGIDTPADLERAAETQSLTPLRALIARRAPPPRSGS